MDKEKSEVRCGAGDGERDSDRGALVARLSAQERFSFDDLVAVMETLRAPGGCPWDREQDHVSLKRYLIEEAYEVLEAIDEKDETLLCEELGDVLLQVVFHANIAAFDIGDVISGVCKKMVTRHPHIFGSVVAETSEAVLTNWEQIKREEKDLTDRSSVLKRVPHNLPALMRAYKVQQKARDAGFDWDDIGPVLGKAAEELDEVREALAAGRADAVQDEIGDLLFAVVNLSRFAKVHPELALTAATEKFIRRFEAMERLAEKDGRALDGMSLTEMDAYWKNVKRAE
ncbi:MAG: nucleoside triphosphate pyrophosphohydrolase [Clostridiales bacterium]|nr:nucleoside triphosphate pyrophosphohydrolase [Clostridiales bacterium]